ncbi:MAG: helix-turn-helix domain-containing protein [Hyphomicrobiaceae bacterium]
MTSKERRAKAVRLVKGGMSYSEAARALGTTRNVVSSACRDAGHKTGGIRPRHRKKIAEVLSKYRFCPGREAARNAARWTPENRAKHSAVMKARHAARLASVHEGSA